MLYLPWLVRGSRAMSLELLFRCFGHLNRRGQLPDAFPATGGIASSEIEPAIPPEN